MTSLCGKSIEAMQPLPGGEGGSSPTLPLNKHEWEVRPCRLEVAQEMVRKHHYAGGGANTAVYTFGMFPRGSLWESECVAITWWIPPTKSAAFATYPLAWQGVLALSRLVAKPGAPSNTCTFLLRHSMRLINRDRWPCLVTYADEWQGHTGAIYRAAGWVYAGQTKPERTYTIEGRMVARKAGPKTRTHAEMLGLGAILVGSFAKKKFVHVAEKTK